MRARERRAVCYVCMTHSPGWRAIGGRTPPSPALLSGRFAPVVPSVLLYGGLAGLAAVLLLSVPANPVFDLSLRRHQQAGMLLSHLSVAAVLAGLCSRRHAFLAGLPPWRPRIWLAVAAAASAAFLALWVALFHAARPYAAALVRESGPLEPLQASLYLVASWLAWQCASRGTGGERRLFRAASGVCGWLVLEEVEYLGLVEVVTGGRVEGVWVRSAHDLIAVGVRVPVVLVVLASITLVVALAGIRHVGLRCLAREATAVTAVPVAAALGALALSQVLDHDNAALARYADVLTYRLEEPLELTAAFLVTIALVMRIGTPAGHATGPSGARDREGRQGARRR